MEIDSIFITTVFLFVITSCLTLLYYRKIREASKDYVKAKTVFDDVVLSFSRDLRRHEEMLEDIDGRPHELSVEQKREIDEVKSDITAVRLQLEELHRTEKSALGKQEQLDSRIDLIAVQMSEISNKIALLESVSRRERVPVTREELSIGGRRASALGELTDTELNVISLLDKEGEKSAPAIRESIRLTREHTARLMKSLYARGYVERKTDKMPYRYFLKNEMKDILREQRS